MTSVVVSSAIQRFKNGGGLDIQSLMETVLATPSRQEASSDEETQPSSKKRKFAELDEEECPEFANFSKTQRMQRNRESAARSRSKKKDYLEQLEKKVQFLMEKVSELSIFKARVHELEQENSTLREQLSNQGREVAPAFPSDTHRVKQENDGCFPSDQTLRTEATQMETLLSSFGQQSVFDLRGASSPHELVFQVPKQNDCFPLQTGLQTYNTHEQQQTPNNFEQSFSGQENRQETPANQKSLMDGGDLGIKYATLDISLQSRVPSFLLSVSSLFQAFLLLNLCLVLNGIQLASSKSMSQLSLDNCSQLSPQNQPKKNQQFRSNNGFPTWRLNSHSQTSSKRNSSGPLPFQSAQKNSDDSLT